MGNSQDKEAQVKTPTDDEETQQNNEEDYASTPFENPEEKHQYEWHKLPIPQRMQALAIPNYSNDSLQIFKLITDAEVPLLTTPEEKKSDHILVRVHYAGLNPIDAKIRKGNLSSFFFPYFPLILGQDFSGTVLQCGSKVTRFQPGDEVFAMKELFPRSSSSSLFNTNPRLGQGSYAEYIAVREFELAHKPPQLGFASAAAIPTAALATHKSLVELSKLQKGQKVLILGASGGVGSYAIQYAKKVIGAEVIAVCSRQNQDYVKSLGADHVITFEYKNNNADNSEKEEDAKKQQEAAVATGDEKNKKKKSKNETSLSSGLEIETTVNHIPDVDVVLDLVGNKHLSDKVWKVLKKKRGKYIFCAMAEEKQSLLDLYLKLGARLIWRKICSFFGAPQFKILVAKPNGVLLEKIIEDHIKYRFKTRIEQVFPDLRSIASAHKLLDEKKIAGKLIARVNPLIPVFAPPTANLIVKQMATTQQQEEETTSEEK